MRALWLLPLLAGCAAPRGPAPVCPGTFTLVNQSGRAIEQLYAGSARDLLEPGIMAPGLRRSFQATGPNAALLRVVFVDGRAAELGPVNLCILPLVVVSQAGMQASAP